MSNTETKIIDKQAFQAFVIDAGLFTKALASLPEFKRHQEKQKGTKGLKHTTAKEFTRVFAEAMMYFFQRHVASLKEYDGRVVAPLYRELIKLQGGDPTKAASEIRRYYDREVKPDSQKLDDLLILVSTIKFPEGRIKAITDVFTAFIDNYLPVAGKAKKSLRVDFTKAIESYALLSPQVALEPSKIDLFSHTNFLSPFNLRAADVDVRRAEKQKEQLATEAVSWRELLKDFVGFEKPMAKLQEIEDHTLAEAERARLRSVFEPQGGVLAKTGIDHFVVTGEPGTGKSSIFYAIAAILFEQGYIDSPEPVIITRSQLVGTHIGETENNVRELFDKHKRRFIGLDEFHTLFDGSGDDRRDFGHRLAETLNAIMTEPGFSNIIGVAGYQAKINAAFKMLDAGLTRRFPEANHINIESPTFSQLLTVLDNNARNDGYQIEDGVRDIVREALVRQKETQKERFGNADAVIKLWRQIKRTQDSVNRETGLLSQAQSARLSDLTDGQRENLRDVYNRMNLVTVDAAKRAAALVGRDDPEDQPARRIGFRDPNEP